MAKRTTKPMADLRASMKRIQVDGEEMVGRLRRDARALLKNGRAEIVRDVRSLKERADKTIRAVENRVLRQVHAATTDQVKRLERRVAKVEQSIAELERRVAGFAKTAA
jgi:F0F1-type ATP synthase membrane subunit b/b'